MQQKTDLDDETGRQAHSDSDDWTLVSPPESANSSPSSNQDSPNTDPLSNSAPHLVARHSARDSSKKRKQDQPKQLGHRIVNKDSIEDRKQQEDRELRASGSQDADDEEDDGLVEIDLNMDEESKCVNTKQGSAERHNSQSNLRLRKSVKNVDLGQVAVCQPIATKSRESPTNCSTSLAQQKQQQQPQQSQQTHLDSHQHMPMEVSLNQRYRRQTASTSTPTSLLFLQAALLFCAINSLVNFVFFNTSEEQERTGCQQPISVVNNASDGGDRSKRLDSIEQLLYIHPQDTATTELLLLDQDLAACIKERGYGWIDKGGKLTHPTKDWSESRNADHKKPNQFKPFRGLVCYEREQEWRKRIKRLKDDFNFDLRRLIRKAQKKLANASLGQVNSDISFKLIINQIEYLDYLDEHRRSEQIERLKARNLELMKQLDEYDRNIKQFTKQNHATPDSATSLPKLNPEVQSKQYHQNHYAPTKALAWLESENVRLKRENEALKASLVEKAGTVYIKQSMELEKCERENNQLKDFHHHVAHDVSDWLKQLDVLTIDPAALLNDHETLSSQLALTRSHLLRFAQEVLNLLEKNSAALKEVQLYKSLIDTLKLNAQSKQIEHYDHMKHLVEDSIDENSIHSVPKISDLRSKDANNNLADVQLSLNSNRSTNKNNPSLESSEGTQIGDSVDNESTVQSPAQIGCTESDRSQPRGNWLMRRAKLRERLRKSAIDILEAQIDRDEYQYRKHPTTYPKNHNHHHSHDMKESSYSEQYKDKQLYNSDKVYDGESKSTNRIKKNKQRQKSKNNRHQDKTSGRDSDEKFLFQEIGDLLIDKIQGLYNEL